MTEEEKAARRQVLNAQIQQLNQEINKNVNNTKEYNQAIKLLNKAQTELNTALSEAKTICQLLANNKINNIAFGTEGIGKITINLNAQNGKIGAVIAKISNKLKQLELEYQNLNNTRQNLHAQLNSI